MTTPTPDVRSDEERILALDAAYQDAVRRNDAAAIRRLLPDDFALVTGKGTVIGKAQLVREAAERSCEYEIQQDSRQTVRVWGDTGVITALLHAKGTRGGAPFEYKLWFSDTYVRTPGGWRYCFAQAAQGLPKEAW